MRLSLKKPFFLFLKLYILSLFVGPWIQHALALSEKFEVYRSPQGLCMGDALTADVSGYASNYYNPAGLASFTRRTKEVTLFDVEGNLGFTGMGTASKGQSFGTYRLFGVTKKNPGDYTYFNFSSLPGFTLRGFSFSLLGVYEYAAKSDGTNLDINTRQDLGATIGFARHFAGNVIKLGIAAKAIIRNELVGNFSHSTFEALDEDTLPGLYKEGIGLGADLGTIITVPSAWLPTFGLVWKDMFNTHFKSLNFINSKASGNPNPIDQSVNAAFSIHPYFSRELKGTIAFEYKHIEDSRMSFKKHTHIGIQIEDDKTFYAWLGLNQLYPTLGLGLRVKGGTLEAGTYAEDVGEGGASQSDRRFIFRYTIGF